MFIAADRIMSQEPDEVASLSKFWEMLGSLWKVAIAGMGAVAVAGLAAGSQLWAMPYPRVVFMTIATGFGLAAMWGMGLYVALSYFSMLSKPKREPTIADRISHGGPAVLAFMSFAFLCWHLYSGARAVGDMRYCLRAPAAFECTLTLSENTPPEQVKKLERLLAPYKGVHWGPD
jgi:hypothetical protein